MEINETRYLIVKGKRIALIPKENGDYVDAFGTIYPAILFDEGFCGIEPFATGKGDPLKAACKSHDAAFIRAKLGHPLPGENTLTVFGDFAIDVGTIMLQSTYSLLAGIPYILVGGLLGMIRYNQLKRKSKT